jgi:hypothetical protein
MKFKILFPKVFYPHKKNIMLVYYFFKLKYLNQKDLFISY